MRFIVGLLFLVGASAAEAQEIKYLSSSSGLLLHRDGTGAVTATWQGQQPIAGFAGYGDIRMDNPCLTGRVGKAQLQWESCLRSDKSQTWAWNRGRLNNELGWCADVEGNRDGAGARVVAWSCSGAVTQRWNVHRPVSPQAYYPSIKDPAIRQAIENFARTARPGQTLPLTPSQAQDVPSELISADGVGVVAAGNGQLISSGRRQ